MILTIIRAIAMTDSAMTSTIMRDAGIFLNPVTGLMGGSWS
jgi:hypothetical protein